MSAVLDPLIINGRRVRRVALSEHEADAMLDRIVTLQQRLQVQANPRSFREREEDPPENLPTNERMQRTPYGRTHKSLPGQTRHVTKIKTTLDHLQERGHITAGMRVAFERFAFDIARSLGASNVEDTDIAIERLPMSKAGYGPRSVSTRQLEGTNIGRQVWLLIHDDLRPIFRQIMAEETGIYIDVVHSPKHWGHEIGRKSEKQAVAAGDTIVRVLCQTVENFYARGLIVDAMYGGRS